MCLFGGVSVQVFGSTDAFTIFVVDIINEYVFTCSRSKITACCWFVQLEQ